ncbi:MAG: CbtB-domain containing protein [Rhodospirillaceae bacterium]|nr:CbtB-domain containing protein [Rhodospirillaceae bacterium]
MIKEQTQSQAQAVVEQTSSKLPAVVALVFGAFIVMGAGFANSQTVHDAAHDVRHAFAVPCH